MRSSGSTARFNAMQDQRLYPPGAVGHGVELSPAGKRCVTFVNFQVARIWSNTPNTHTKSN